MTGHNWTSREEHFIHAPAEYGAIHFHDDDLEDAGWKWISSCWFRTRCAPTFTRRR